MNRRRFLQALGWAGAVSVQRAAPSAGAISPPAPATARESTVRQSIERNRPSVLHRLPDDFCGRVGATHVAGKYHLTEQPFLIEGATKLLELGTRLGKFWFEPHGAARSYPFHSDWKDYAGFVALARSDWFHQLLELPFTTFILEASSPLEEGWRRAQPDRFYEAISEEFAALTAHLYRTLRERPVTVVLQHWEGDWLLRGRAGATWEKPPSDWQVLCQRMQRWLNARQTGVRRARAAAPEGAKCRVAHAAEVNRVTDLWAGIPTVTDKVLPGVELDLVSYSAYDALHDAPTLVRCIDEIRRHATTGPLYGPGAVYLGEIGIPENEQPNRLAERWDELLGAALAARVQYIVHWQLYCNELNPSRTPPPRVPVRDPQEVRGFWLVKPDGSLSVSGEYLRGLWARARKGS